MAELYESLPQASGRLVIIGAPGSGRTTTARRLVAELAEGDVPTERPVPVLADLSSWNPASEGVEGWFVSRLSNRYSVDETAVRRLVTGRNVLPVLDGLDELPSSQHTRAIAVLSRWLLGFPGYVLTCRPSVHEDMTDLLGTSPGMTATLLPLPASAVSTYLREADAQRWAPVADTVEQDVQGRLAEALSSPWFLSLAVDGYEGPEDRDPAELTDSSRFPDAESVRDRIAGIADQTARIESGEEDAQDGGRRKRQLELLTDAMGHEEDGLLLWWRMAERYGSQRVLWGVTAALLGIPVILAAETNRKLGLTMLALTAGYLVFCRLAEISTFSQTGQLPRRIGRLSRMLTHPHRDLGDRSIYVFLFCAWYIVLSISAVKPTGVSATTITLLTACVLTGLVILFTGPDTDTRRARPVGDRRGDLWAALLVSAVVTFLVCLSFYRLRADVDPTGRGLPWYIWAALAVGFFSATLLHGSAWGRYRLTHLGLVLAGELPPRLDRFLADAQKWRPLVPADGYGAGCYSFRHDQVRRALGARVTGRLPHVRTTERFEKDIHAEVLLLPESVAYLAHMSDGSPETYEQEAGHVSELAQRALTGDLRAVADRGFASYERRQRARGRMSDAVRVPRWARPRAARFYSVLALVAGGITARGVGLWLDLDLRRPEVVTGAVVAVVAPLAYMGYRTDSLSDEEIYDYFRSAFSKGRSVVFIVFWCLVGFLEARYTEAFVPEHTLTTVAWATAFLAVLALVAWALARPHVTRARAVEDDDPSVWPVLPVPHDRHRDAALQAHRDWLTIVARDGVMPLIRSRLRVSEDTAESPDLPAIAPSRLTGTRSSDQFVDTAAADEIAFHLRELESASIGVSGPRGAGKSSLMQRFCTPGPTSAADDLLVLVPAPTSYDPREFLIHLFAEVCRRIIGEEPTADGRPGADTARRTALGHRLGGFLILVAGFIVVLTTLLWPHRTAATDVITGHAEALLLSGGALLIVAGLAWILTLPGRAERQAVAPADSAEASAAAHLRTLHYQLTLMRTRSAQFALPGGLGLQLADGQQVQHTQQILTYPELVARFRGFLDQVSLERRALGGRVVIGIDELDKLGSAQETERFLNDLKVVFGIRGCHFLVAVSEDALTAFGRHVLDVRTVFDSAFDRVVALNPLGLPQARELLELRGVRLPEPYLWLCQVLSGGLPRDLLRAVMSLAVERTVRNTADLRSLARKLIEEDARAVLSAQTRYTATLTGEQAPAAARWIAEAFQAPVTSDDWTAITNNAPDIHPDEYGTARVVAQVRAYLVLGATLTRIFAEEDARPDSIELLTTARGLLATEPESALAAVTRYRREVLGWLT
ncbi:NACHT domain-containing protein [Streptomyces graminofaciens]|uniref:NACHT domain-containing protein n=1 Tax=Streptomyces graminofaciens TaxID=68212 RepID=UPI002572A54A|nr:NACHT domain-containing protein [Streptomyces graminofaciens]